MAATFNTLNLHAPAPGADRIATALAAVAGAETPAWYPAILPRADQFLMPAPASQDHRVVGMTTRSGPSGTWQGVAGTTVRLFEKPW